MVCFSWLPFQLLLYRRKKCASASWRFYFVRKVQEDEILFLLSHNMKLCSAFSTCSGQESGVCQRTSFFMNSQKVVLVSFIISSSGFLRILSSCGIRTRIMIDQLQSSASIKFNSAYILLDYIVLQIVQGIYINSLCEMGIVYC